MPAAGQRTTGPCGCCGACVIFADNFNRADEEWPYPTAFDSTGQWQITNISSARPWSVSGNLLNVNTAASGASPAINTSQISTAPAASITIRCKLPASGEITFALTIQTGGDLGVSETREQASVEAQIEVGATCGVLRLRDAASSFDRDIPVPGLVADQWHTLKLCLDTQTQLASATVTVHGGGAYSHHVKNVTISTTAAQLNPLVRAGLTLTPVDLTYYFDDFSMNQTKGSLGGTYAYAGDSTCPCCGGGDCQAVSDDFADGSIDCQWEQTSGTWSESGGTISSADGGAMLTWLGSWNGIDLFCTPDDTTFVEAVVQAADYGAVARVYVDVDGSGNSHYAELTVESSAGAADGTLKLFSSASGTPLSSETVSYLTIDTPFAVRVCFNGGVLSAWVSNVSDALAGISTAAGIVAFGGSQWGIGNGASTPLEFLSVAANHNTFDPACGGCFGGVAADCSDCSGGVSEYLAVVMGAADNGTVSGICDGPDCAALAHTFTLRRAPELDADYGAHTCVWRLAVEFGTDGYDAATWTLDGCAGLVVIDDTNEINPWNFEEFRRWCSGAVTWTSGDPPDLGPVSDVGALVTECFFASETTPTRKRTYFIVERVLFSPFFGTCVVAGYYVTVGFDWVFDSGVSAFRRVFSVTRETGDYQWGAVLPADILDHCDDFDVTTSTETGYQDSNLTDPCNLRTNSARIYTT